MSQSFVATARESEKDPRTYVHDLASPITYTKGGKTFTTHENQHTVGICTAISLIQNAEMALNKKYSPDFQYLLQKKYFDMDWTEGSSIFSALKAAKKYGFLPSELFTWVTEADRILPYSQYIAKLQSIPDSEIQRLLALCEPKLTGYAMVDVSSKENIAHAIESSKSGILCRYTVTDRWWTPSWNPSDIDPLKGDGNVVGGHAINMTAYDYTNGEITLLSNTWSNLWDVQGNAHADYSVYKPTEAFIPYYDTTPVATKFTQYLQLGSTGSEVKMLQVRLGVIQTGYFGTLTQKAVKAFQAQHGIEQTGTVGPKTRAVLNSSAGEALPNNQITMTGHTLRTIGLLALMFVIAGLQALHSAPELTQYSGMIDMFAAMLLTVEHLMQGNTGPTA